MRAERHIGVDEAGGSDQPVHAGTIVETVGAPERRIGVALRVTRYAVAFPLPVRLMAERRSLPHRRRFRASGRPRARAAAAWACPAHRRFPHRQARAEELDIGHQRLHLPAVHRQITAVHAALHAAFDPFFQRAHLVFAADILGEQSVHADHGDGELLRAALEMTALAGEVVSGIAHVRLATSGPMTA